MSSLVFLCIGAMAAVGLTWEEVQRRLPPSLDAACHNAADSVTVSGAVADIDAFVEQLQSEGVFNKKVNSSNNPFHSRHMRPVAKPMREALSKVCGALEFIYSSMHLLTIAKPHLSSSHLPNCGLPDGCQAVYEKATGTKKVLATAPSITMSIT